MRTIRIAFWGLFSLVIVCAGQAYGQPCANAVPINCGDTVSEDSGSGTNVL